MLRYTPPTLEDLRALKEHLGYTGKQMADLASVAGDQQWRKYTGGAAPRQASLHMLFFIAARLELPPESFAAVLARMREIGATVEDDLRPRNGTADFDQGPGSLAAHALTASTRPRHISYMRCA